MVKIIKVIVFPDRPLSYRRVEALRKLKIPRSNCLLLPNPYIKYNRAAESATITKKAHLLWMFTDFSFSLTGIG